jgi:phosphate transport system substrate-binding protein
MAFTRGRCTNLDYCSIAASRRDVEVRVGDDFVCPECGKPLKAPQGASKQGPNYVLPAIIGGAVLVLVAGGVVIGLRVAGSSSPGAAPQTAATTAQSRAPGTALPPPPAQPAVNVLARLAGSAHLGRGVAAPLAAAYLADIGDTDVRITPGDAANVVQVTGIRGDRREAIAIDMTSAASGFKALGDHSADIVLSPRRIAATEKDALAPLGDMTAPTAEHLLGVGALAIVVNSANALPGLRRDQIAGIFNGTIRDWSALGGSASPMDVFAPAGTTELGTIISSLALNGGAMGANVQHPLDASGVANSVAADPRSIGVVDLADIGKTRAVPIADTGATPVSPTDHAAVAHEDYPFAYRVYLYTAPGAASGIAQRFADYALSPAGQAVIEKNGLVSQTAKPPPPVAPVTAAGSYKEFVAGAKKIAITFHFQPNSTDLDLKGTRDLDRVMNYILSNHFSPSDLILVGFADNQGDPAANITMSKKRADAVAALFTARGLKPGKVGGYGSELEVADNSTEEGREKNRRVEVYIKQ